MRPWRPLLAHASVTAALAAVSLVGGLLMCGGCGGRGDSSAVTGSPAAGTDIEQVAIVTPEKANDYGWNQQGVAGVREAADVVGAELIVQDGAGYGDITPIMEQLAATGADFIVPWASGYNTVGPQVARTLGIPVTANDLGSEDASVPQLVQALETNGQNGGYLAGVLAGRMTRSGTVAIVVSAEDLNWSKQAGGFVAGVRSVSGAARILYVQIGQGAYADAAGGKRVAANAISGGADIIFGMGDGSSFGMMQAVETAEPPRGAEEVWFIDVIGDKRPIDEKGVLLSSVLWDWAPLMTRAFRDFEAGTMGQASYYLDLDNGMGLLQTEFIPDDVWAAVEEARAGILDGSIEVPLTTTGKQVKDLIASGE